MQADALLYLQTHLRRMSAGTQGSYWDGMKTWYGQLGPYWGSHGSHGKFTLFLRCASQAFLQDWLSVFGLPSAEALRVLVNNRNRDPHSYFQLPSETNHGYAVTGKHLFAKPGDEGCRV